MTAEQDAPVADRYRLGALLGQGGMADVYEAMDERLARPVAVKLLRPEMADRDDVRLRFEAEARSAARLSHPNVVNVFDTGEDDAGRPYIVMERLPGETLADRMVEGPVDEDWLRRVTGDILGALGAAHAAGIVHRDVKPGNILIASDGCDKVADFGIDKSLESSDGRPDLTATNMLIGTPAYLSPEQIDGHGATARSDLWALGVVLYEALAGRKPFTGKTPLATAFAIQHGEVEPLASVRPDVDPTMAEVVERAMRRDPDERFGSASEMAAALGVAPPAGGLDPTVAVPVAAGAAASAAAADSPPTQVGGAPVVVPAPMGRALRRLPVLPIAAAGALLVLVILLLIA